MSDDSTRFTVETTGQGKQGQTDDLHGGKSPEGSQKQKVFLLVDKLSLFNRRASSGLRENVLPCKTFINVHIYNNINE